MDSTSPSRGVPALNQLSQSQQTLIELIQGISRFPREASVVAYMESSLGTNVSSRYEELFDLRHLQFDRTDSTSFGIFQFMGFNLSEQSKSVAALGFWSDEDQIRQFDDFWENLSGDLWNKFKRYNGSGPAAERYANKAMEVYSTWFEPVSRFSADSRQESLLLPVLMISGLVVFLGTR